MEVLLLAGQRELVECSVTKFKSSALRFQIALGENNWSGYGAETQSHLSTPFVKIISHGWH